MATAPDPFDGDERRFTFGPKLRVSRLGRFFVRKRRARRVKVWRADWRFDSHVTVLP